MSSGRRPSTQRGGRGRRDSSDRDRRADRDRSAGRGGRAKPAGRERDDRPSDPVRQVAFDVLRAISERDAYANLLLPELLRERGVTGRDAALATELTYGTARAQGLLDEIITACLDRDLSRVDEAVLDGLRLGAYQLLRTRVPDHAAVASTVQLIRETVGSHVAGFANAVLRRVSERDEAEWLDALAPGPDTDPIGDRALRTAHPRWIARAFAEALGDTGDELAAALEADDARPAVHLLALPGVVSADELAAITGGDVTDYSPYGVQLPTGTGDLTESEVIQERLAVVQDEGSQLVSLALTRPEIGEETRWLDLAAGPGGKTVLLGSLAAVSGVVVDAVDQAPHRSQLVTQATEDLPVHVYTRDGRDPRLDGGYDRVLVDAPCSGLGALRRRPESRWRRQPADIAELTRLQSELLASAFRLLRPGGVVAYVVCSPHVAETEGVFNAVMQDVDAEILDAREYFPDIDRLGEGPYVQLWPHRHGTDAMFCAMARKREADTPPERDPHA